MNDRTPFWVVFAAVILGASLVVGLWLHAWENGQSNGTNILTVTGSVKKNVTSDLAKWTMSFTRQADLSTLKSVLEKNVSDTKNLKTFIMKYGISGDAVTFLPVQTDPIYENNGKGYETQHIIGYTVRQEVHVEYTDISKVDSLAQDAKKLIDIDIVPAYQRTEYFYTKIADLRPELFAAATKDAERRAAAVASGTGATVGKLRSARTGVIQVQAPNSTDFSDYGAYDTSTKNKEISATVTVTFSLK